MEIINGIDIGPVVKDKINNNFSDIFDILNTDVVHKTGDETIDGYKTLLKPIKIKNSAIFGYIEEDGQAVDNGGLRRIVNDGGTYRIDRNTASDGSFNSYYKDITIDKYGNVGIGNIYPTEKLEVNGNTRLNGIIKFGSSSNAYITEGYGYNVHLGDTSTYKFRLYTDSREVMYARGDGYIGVGTTSPEAYFHIKSPYKQILLEDSDDGKKWHIETNSSGLSFVETDIDHRLYIAEGGKVGIGTKYPSEKLEVAGRIKTSFSTGAYSLLSETDYYNGVVDIYRTEDIDDDNGDTWRLELKHYYRNNTSGGELNYTIYGYPIKNGSIVGYDQLMKFHYNESNDKWTNFIFRQINMPDLPTSPDGLSSGDLRNDNGTVKII